MKKRVIACCLSLVLLVGLLPAARGAALTPAHSSNMGAQIYGNWSSPVRSYLLGASGSLTRVEALEREITVEVYGSGLALEERLSIPMELPLFGGFFEGADANYFVFGQGNPSYDDSLEVIRVVKYSKDWDRLGQASLSGCNTQYPFDAGSLRMEEYGGILYVRTSHTMYPGSDGKNHQANLTFSVDQATMKVMDQVSGVLNSGYGYVSHSFNQFIGVSGDTLAAVDHGDAYPRAITLITYSKPADSGQISSGGCHSVDILRFPGALGRNATGATVGGFAATSGGYLIAGSSVMQDESFEQHRTHNIFLSTVTPGGQVAGQTKAQTHWLTSYVEGSENSASTPHLVPLEDGTLLLLWQRLEQRGSHYGYAAGEVIEVARVNGSGQLQGEVLRLEGRLSDCVPTVVGNEVIWYVTEGGPPVLYGLDLGEMKLYSRQIPVGDLEHFQAVQDYVPFSDVKEEDWFYPNAGTAYQLGLMQGSGGAFHPEEYLTIGEAITLAARTYSIYIGDGMQFDAAQGAWYQPYEDYTRAAGITRNGYADYGAYCSRQELVRIFSRVIYQGDLRPIRPAVAFTDLNSFETTADSDLATLFYRAGVLNGIPDGEGVRFGAGLPITRAETAAILTRLAIPELRQTEG